MTLITHWVCSITACQTKLGSKQQAGEQRIHRAMLTDLSMSSNTPTLVEVCSPLCCLSCCCSWSPARPCAACLATTKGGGPSGWGWGGCTAGGQAAAASSASSSVTQCYACTQQPHRKHSSIDEPLYCMSDAVSINTAM